MATWTDIPDEVLEPGKPIRSVDALALRDNPIAIAGAAAGAPRITSEALMPAAAGNTFTLFSALQEPSVFTPGMSFPDAADSISASVNNNIPIAIMCSGVIRVSFRHRGRNNVGHIARVVLNGNVIQEWTTHDSEWQNRTIDVSVSIGDRLTFQARRSALATEDVSWGSFLIQSETRCLGVA